MIVEKIVLKNFRVLSENDVAIDLNKKILLLIGKNDSGKSSLIYALKNISRYLNGEKVEIVKTDLLKRDKKNSFIFRIYGNLEKIPQENEIIEVNNYEKIWLEYKWNLDNKPYICDNSFSEINNIDELGIVFHQIFEKIFTGQVNINAYKKAITNDSEILGRKIQIKFPIIEIIPEFRMINYDEKNRNFQFNGTNLRDLLAKYKNPKIDDDSIRDDYIHILDMVRDLSEYEKIDFSFPPNSEEFIVDNENFRLPITNYGTGFHQLLIMATGIILTKDKICCIEEPENHIHPELQKRFIKYLVNIPNRHFIITSHSPVLINSIPEQSQSEIISFQKKDNKSIIKKVELDSEKIELIKDLGVSPSDILLANCIIWVEGPSDRIYIRKWLSIFANDLIEGIDYIFSFYKQIVSLTTGLEPNHEEDYINIFNINPNNIVIEDSDKRDLDDNLQPKKEELKRKIESNGGIYISTQLREIENYLPMDLIIRSLNTIGVNINDLSIDPFEDFSGKIDPFLKANSEFSYSKKKRDISKLFMENFTEADITEELKNFLEKIVENIRKYKIM